MYSFPCCQPYYFNMMRQEISYIRALHASPGAPGVDVYANGDLIARNLRYRGFTPYLQVPAGQYNIIAYPTGKTKNQVIDTNITLKPNSVYTAAAIGTLPNTELYTIQEPRVIIRPGRTNIRFVHLSPDAPAVDIALPNGNVLFSNVGYKGVTDYIPVTPGRYTILVKAAGTDNIVLRIPNVHLRPGLNISIYAVGLAHGKPGLQALIPLDGNTYLGR